MQIRGIIRVFTVNYHRKTFKHIGIQTRLWTVSEDVHVCRTILWIHNNIDSLKGKERIDA